jgi:hypothetical protein
LHDYSRRNNWGTLTNMDPATDWIVSGGAYALDFDGSNDNVQANLVLSGRSTRLSVCCWAWLSSTSLKGAFIRIGFTSGGNNDGLMIGVGNTSMDTLGNNVIGGYEGLRWIATGVAYGTGWHHVGMNVNGSGFPVIFLDGKQVYSDASGAMTAIGTFGGLTELGGYNQPGFGGFPRYFAGYCDDFRVYDRELSPGEYSILARRRGIAFTPRARRLAVTEQAAGGATPWLYARRRSQIIGAGGVH